jgi:lysophospholipase L1-like esterase
MHTYGIAMVEVATKEKIGVIDFFDVLISHPDFLEIMEGSLDDGLHFGRSGYTLLANLIYEYVLGRENL